MNIPTVPTDNFYKLLFFIGVLISVYSNTALDSRIYSIQNKIIEGKNEITSIGVEIPRLSYKLRIINQEQNRLRLTYKADSLQKIMARKKDSIEILEKRIGRNIPKELKQKADEIKLQLSQGLKNYNPFSFDSTFEKLNSDIDGKLDEFMILEGSIKRKEESLKINVDLIKSQQERLNELITDSFFYNLLSFVFIIIGLRGWLSFQKKQDKLIDQQIRITHCQSCGVDFKYDDSKTNSSNYCTHCFDGTNFTNPSLKFAQISKDISKQMKSLKFNRIQIWLYLRKIKQLDRWRKEFRW